MNLVAANRTRGLRGRFLLSLVFFLLSIGAIFGDEWDPSPPISVDEAQAFVKQCRTHAKSHDDRIVCVEGPIDERLRAHFFAELSPKAKAVYINSSGGQVDSAIEIANEILDRHLDVIVDRACFSSCANYIFLAGRRKFLVDKVVAAWHGTPASTPIPWEELNEAARGRLLNTLEKNRLFFERMLEFGVKEGIATNPPPDVVAQSTQDHGRVYGWGYSDSILAKKFGVRGVIRILSERN